MEKCPKLNIEESEVRHATANKTNFDGAKFSAFGMYCKIMIHNMVVKFVRECNTLELL